MAKLVSGNNGFRRLPSMHIISASTEELISSCPSWIPTDRNRRINAHFMNANFDGQVPVRKGILPFDEVTGAYIAR